MANYNNMQSDVAKNNTGNKWVVPNVKDTMTIEELLSNRDLLFIFQEFWSEKLSEQTGGLFSGDKRGAQNISSILDYQAGQIEDYNAVIEAAYPGFSGYYPAKPEVCAFGVEAEPACKEAIRLQAAANVLTFQTSPPGTYLDPVTGEPVTPATTGGNDYGLYVLIALTALVGYKVLFKKKTAAA